MKMTVKKKMAAGAISVGLLSGIGLAFANTDSGGALKTWYSGIFNDASAEVTDSIDQYVMDQREDLLAEYDGMKAGAGQSIDMSRDSEIAGSTTAINNAKQSHLDSLGAAKDQILAGMQQQFDAVYQQEYLRIQEAGDRALRAAETDLTSYTDNKGSAAIEEVTTQLNAVKEQAVTALEQAIANAKSEITTQVETEKTSTVNSLKIHVDHKIDALFNEIHGIILELVAAQEALIEAKAAELEAAAITALDDVVSGINE
ncbi:hypothetical protein QT711_07520 [Sporosarcina saromensis]|uniref:Uncharacterized protein n=1 Tax=Sporosarcina saromensis TaxID=359365 RepID=A0ABU4G7T5_9BACL|nr:hypothetical protein [Sporosarcina saromensis]MDW0113031.1 hypothetical protein [Sporosarcina saromensis]